MKNKLKISSEIESYKLAQKMNYNELGNYMIINILSKRKWDDLDSSVINRVIEEIFKLQK